MASAFKIWEVMPKRFYLVLCQKARISQEDRTILKK